MNYRVLLHTAAAWCVASFAVSFVTKDWSWFARSGSFLTVASVLLAARKSIRDAGQPEKASRTEDSQAAKDKDATEWAFAFLVVGTAIWGYGDLLKCIFGGHS